MLKLSLSKESEKKMEEILKNKLGEKIEKLVRGFHNEFLKTTPVNSGITVASWKVTKGVPSNYDAGDFDIDPYDFGEIKPTNTLPVGSEPNRIEYEKLAKDGIQLLQISKNPFNKFVVSNGAKIRSLLSSPYDQSTVGLRAALMNAGAIPGYSIQTGQSNFYDPRGQGMFQKAISEFLNNYRKRYLRSNSKNV